MAYSSDWPRAIIHLDGDAFFASCEQALHPEYRGKPVVTGKERGIVSAASYEAKALGISRGVALWDVPKICPEAIIVPSDYESYSLFSERMFTIMRRFTSDVEEYGIDEGFADITGLDKPLRMSYGDIARSMQEMVIKELGISVSVGLSTSKVLAKLGSKHHKPGGFVVIPNSEREPYLAATPAEKLWGIGRQTARYCQKIGIHTALDFAQQNERVVKARFTKPHLEMWHELNGRSVYPVVSNTKDTYQSIGKTRTFTPPSTDRNFLFAHLLKNIENACIKARRYHLVANRFSLYLRQQDFRGSSIEGQLPRASAYPHDFTAVAHDLFRLLYRPHIRYRATGVIIWDLVPDTRIQTSLFEAPRELTRQKHVYEAIDTLAGKFGKHAVHLLGSAPAHDTPQHVHARGDLPVRKQQRLRGETARKHLTIPLLLHRLQ